VADPRAGGGSPDATWAIAHAGGWLASRDGEDTLLYLHLMDPHEPYRSHGADAPPLPPLRPLAHRERTARPEETARFRERYAGEVAHVDGVLGPFLADLPERSTVLLTSDHGESLGEHGSWGHGLDLYQTAVAVPLLLVGPDVPSGVTDTPRQLLDVAPTLAELAGVEVPAGARGRSLLEDPGDEPIVSATFGAGPLRWALRTGPRKVVVRTAPQAETARPEWLESAPLPTGAFLFDLAVDPHEQAPTVVPEDLMQRAGGAFVESAGRLVPGLQLLIWNEPGSTSAEVEVSGDVQLIQAWSPGKVTAEREESRLRLRCETAEPFCAAAFDVGPEPPSVRPTARHAWNGVSAGADNALADLGLPAALRPGAWMWWNPKRETVVGGHDETLERLRALGYIE
jgi:hypothetical protein